MENTTVMMRTEELGIAIDKDFILNNVICCTESREAYESGRKDYEILEKLDLIMYFRVIIDEEKSFKITKGIMEGFGITLQVVSAAAFKNARAKIHIQNLGEFFTGFEDPHLPDILTSKNRMWGGGAICFTDVFKGLCEKHNADHCYILPSSIHELLIQYPIPDSDSKEIFDNMVKQVNATVLQPEDILADHCYRFDVATNEITF